MPQALLRIERALDPAGRSGAAAGLFDLARDNGAAVALKDIGMRVADLDSAADRVVGRPYGNPREIGPAQRADIRRLLQDAYEGVRPD